MNIDALENALREECPPEQRLCVGDGTQVHVMLDGNRFDIARVEMDTDGHVLLRLEG